MQVKLSFLILLFSTTTSVFAEEFINSAACERRAQQLNDQHHIANEQFNGCSVDNKCDGVYISSAQRDVRYRRIKSEVDAIYSQLMQVRKVCSQMARAENEQKRQEAFSAATESQRLERQDIERRQSIDRHSEAVASASRQQREEISRLQEASRNTATEASRERDRQARSEAIASAIESQKRDAKAQAIGSLIGLVSKHAFRDNVDYVAEKENLSETQKKYSDVQAGIEKYQSGAQGGRSSMVAAQQNAAWAELREKNLSTLGELDNLSKDIASIQSGPASETNTLFKGTPLAQNPWAESGVSANAILGKKETPRQVAKETTLAVVSPKLSENPWGAAEREGSRQSSQSRIELTNRTAQSLTAAAPNSNKVNNPWANEEVISSTDSKNITNAKIAVASTKNLDSQSASTFIHPSTLEVFKIQPGQTLFRSKVGGPLNLRSIEKIVTASGDSDNACTKNGVGIVKGECERIRHQALSR
jgi:hypothetical protein